MIERNTTGGRPKSKASLRNFRFSPSVDSFLVSEKTRTGRDMTSIMELALTGFMRLKPSARDSEFLRLRKES